MDPLMWGLLVVVHRTSKSALLFPLPALSSLEHFQLLTSAETESLEFHLTCDDGGQFQSSYIFA